MDLDAIADHLYGLPLGEFTAARTNSEKEAKAAGEKELAAAVRGLAKPTAAAWLANQLVRQHAAEIKPLLQLGAGLREATATLQGDQLRELGRQQYQLIAALVRQAKAIAGTVSDDTARGLESTLRAALADETAADQLSAGRLTVALERTGFPPASDARAVSAPPRHAAPTPPAAKATHHASRAKALATAEHEEQQAKFASHKANDELASAQRAADNAEQAAREAAEEVERLRDELDDAISEQAGLDQQARRSLTELESADKAARQAARTVAEATQQRRKLAADG